MKHLIVIAVLILIIGCKMKNKKEEQENTAYSFYLGTYTDAESKGIYKYFLHTNGTLQKGGLAAKSENPSFLAYSNDKKYLLAVNEISNEENVGTIESFLTGKDSLSFISRSQTGGAHPCFICINKSGYILTANYTGGNVGLLQINLNGVLSNLLDLQQHNGNGTTERQKGPHAHYACFEPGSNRVVSVDLGTNELWFSMLDTAVNKLVPSAPFKLAMKEGAGPRHLAFHPNGKWLYVLNELNSTISIVQKNEANEFEIITSFSTLPNGFTGPNTGAEIIISSDGHFLYASNRGHNSIAIFEINKNDGTLVLVEHEPTHGDSPRNFALTPDEKFLLVANQKSNNIVSFTRDVKNGMLKFADKIEARSPVCILF